MVECTGVGELVLGAMQATRPDGIVCLTGVSSGGRSIPVDAGELNRDLVLENDVVFGSVNAAKRHYEQAAASLAKADPGLAGPRRLTPRPDRLLARGAGAPGRRRQGDRRVRVNGPR